MNSIAFSNSYICRLHSLKASFARVYHSAWENGRVNCMTLNATPIWMIHWKYTSEWYTLVNDTCRWMIMNSGDVWIVNDNDPKCICMSREHLNATLQKCMRMHVLGIKMWMQQVTHELSNAWNECECTVYALNSCGAKITRIQGKNNTWPPRVRGPCRGSVDLCAAGFHW